MGTKIFKDSCGNDAAVRVSRDMDEKDRHLVTFDNGFSYDEDIPDFNYEPVKPVSPEPPPVAPTPSAGTVPASSGTIPPTPVTPSAPSSSGPTPVSSGTVPAAPTTPATPAAVKPTTPVTPQVSPSSGTIPASSGSAQTSSGTVPPPPMTPPTRTGLDPDPAAPQRPSQAAELPAAHERRTYSAPAHARTAEKAAREKKYVTKGVLVAFMIATMIVSALIGAVAGATFSKMGTTVRAERNDSKLSQLNLSDATGSELTVAEIVEKNENSVVEIVVSGTAENMWGQLQLTQGAGSGVIVRKDGYIATNYHVIQGASKVEVTLHDGTVYNAKIIGSDPENDIAVIKVDADDLIPVEIGDSSKVVVGDLAVAIGNPLGQLGGTATSGIISALDRTLTIEGTTLTLLQTDAAINGGNSGGGLFNGRGELIGIVESKASAVGVEGLAFALPVNPIAEIINDMIETGNSPDKKATPAVGIVISDVSENNAEYYGLEEAGVYIAQVTGANAQKAGFQEKDRIVSLDGKEIKESSEFISLVRKHNVGDTVTIVVSRNGQQIEIKTELEELQSAG